MCFVTSLPTALRRYCNSSSVDRSAMPLAEESRLSLCQCHSELETDTELLKSRLSQVSSQDKSDKSQDSTKRFGWKVETVT